MLFIFGESGKLAAAYGLSVAGAMSITGVLMRMIFMFKRQYFKMGISIIAGLSSLVFFVSCWLKIPHGGYWSLIIASVPLFIVILYTQGQKRLYASFVPIDKELFLANTSNAMRKDSMSRERRSFLPVMPMLSLLISRKRCFKTESSMSATSS